VGSLLAASDLCTLPSLWEGLPLCLIEAMAARRAVVASDVNGNREVVRHGGTGFLVPPKDPTTLAEYLGWLISDPMMRLRFGLMGRERVESNFRLDRMVSHTEEVYFGVLRE
jgi:starch synthase (maltosyl-transferring)